MPSNRFIDDVIKYVREHEQFSDIEIYIIAKRLEPQPTEEEREEARKALYGKEKLDGTASK